VFDRQANHDHQPARRLLPGRGRHRLVLILLLNLRRQAAPAAAG
jgi:hypothetical protein